MLENKKKGDFTYKNPVFYCFEFNLMVALSFVGVLCPKIGIFIY